MRSLDTPPWLTEWSALTVPDRSAYRARSVSVSFHAAGRYRSLRPIRLCLATSRPSLFEVVTGEYSEGSRFGTGNRSITVR